MARLLIEAGGSRSSWYLLTGGVIAEQYEGSAINLASTTDRTLSSAEVALCDKADEAVVYLAGFDGSPEMIAAACALLGLDDVACYNDLHAVWHACDRQDGIFCLLGTGSQSFCVEQGVFRIGQPSLGYLISDEGSGYEMGRAVLRAYLYGQLLEEVEEVMMSDYQLDRSSILKCLYKKGSPATYVASFTKVLSQYRQAAWASDIITRALSSFIDLRVTCFSDHLNHSIIAAGGIAAVFEDELRFALADKGFTLTKVIKSPITHLINHYLSDS